MPDVIANQSFIVACRKFFGFLPDQTLMGFKQELDALTEKDRADLKVYFAEIGINITN